MSFQHLDEIDLSNDLPIPGIGLNLKLIGVETNPDIELEVRGRH